jgi:hypothetical protein
MIKFKSKFYIYTSIFNLTILGFYLLNFDLPKSSKLFTIIIILSIICFISIFKITFNKLLSDVSNNLQISIFAIIILFIILELLFILSPKIYPNDFSIWIDKTNKKDRIMVIDYLDRNPYVKFKPEKEIRIKHYRGRTDQFEYTWVTDSNGFKNNDDILNNKKIDIVALGDSFTEGMGVKTLNTYSSILTSKGYPTYNLGVQGYSPTQVLGSFKEFGLKLKPKIVIAQYTMNTYTREKNFLDKNDINFTGGIASIEKFEVNPDLRNQAKYVISGFWLFTKNVRILIKNKFKKKKLQLVDKKFTQYQNLDYIQFFDSKPKDIISWNSTLSVYNELNDICKDIGAKFVLLYIPKRASIYFERAFGETLSINTLKEAELLKNFASENDFIFLDPSSRLKIYVNSLPKEFDLKELPYLEFDGHMNKIGYNIVSDIIIDEIKKTY